MRYGRSCFAFQGKQRRGGGGGGKKNLRKGKQEKLRRRSIMSTLSLYSIFFGLGAGLGSGGSCCKGLGGLGAACLNFKLLGNRKKKEEEKKGFLKGRKEGRKEGKERKTIGGGGVPRV